LQDAATAKHTYRLVILEMKINGGRKMVRILGFKIGEKDKEEEKAPKVCKHPIMQRGTRLNPEKNVMEFYCKKCGETVVEE